MAPTLEGMNDCEEFLVVNIVASFWWRQGMGIVADRAWKTGGSTLKENGPKGKLGGIDFDFKRSVMVWAVKSHVAFNQANEAFHSRALFVTPMEGDVLLQEVGEGPCNFRKTGNERAVVAKHPQGASHARDGALLGRPF
jgi:hypothetical protein